MVRISDARMSGTAYGSIVLHVTPDAASGGPLAKVKNGDHIRLSVKERRIDVLVPPDELARRPAARRPSPSAATPASTATNPASRSRLRFQLPAPTPARRRPKPAGHTWSAILSAPAPPRAAARAEARAAHGAQTEADRGAARRGPQATGGKCVP